MMPGWLLCFAWFVCWFSGSPRCHQPVSQLQHRLKRAHAPGAGPTMPGLLCLLGLYVGLASHLGANSLRADCSILAI